MEYLMKYTKANIIKLIESVSNEYSVNIEYKNVEISDKKSFDQIFLEKKADTFFSYSESTGVVKYDDIKGAMKFDPSASLLGSLKPITNASENQRLTLYNNIDPNYELQRIVDLLNLPF